MFIFAGMKRFGWIMALVVLALTACDATTREARRPVRSQNNALESLNLQGLASGQYVMKVTMTDGTAYSNKVVKEWLKERNYDIVIPEYTFGESRIDFYMERADERTLMEVKGCTLEVDGIGYFPDAPTVRGVKHIRELMRAKREGYRAILAFVIQMDGITEVRANEKMHPEFGEAMEEAKSTGVEVIFLPCHVEVDGLRIVTR